MVDWILTVLFCLGVLFIPVGIALILVPQSVMRLGESSNRWISTNGLVNSLDSPRNHERLFYKYHHLFGVLIVLGSAFSLYVLVYNNGITDTAESISHLADTVAGEWLLETAYYILSGACVLALLVGLVIIVRPSLLKAVEAWGNRWIDTGSTLEKLDQVHDIPTNVLPGKPRTFGIFVLICAVYIVYITSTRIF